MPVAGHWGGMCAWGVGCLWGACCRTWIISQAGGSRTIFSLLQFSHSLVLMREWRDASRVKSKQGRCLWSQMGALSWPKTLWPTIWILWEFWHCLHLPFLVSFVFWFLLTLPGLLRWQTVNLPETFFSPELSRRVSPLSMPAFHQPYFFQLKKKVEKKAIIIRQKVLIFNEKLWQRTQKAPLEFESPGHNVQSWHLGASSRKHPF